MKKTVFRTLSCAAVAAVMMFSSGAALSVSADWQKEKNGYSYTNDDGEKLTGWHTINGEKYYFSKKGIAASGFKTIGGKKYYFIKTKKGMMATGWQKIGADKYYFGTNGAMRTGWQTISGKRYYFESSGKMVVGNVKIKGKSYSFGSDGALIEGTAATGVANVKLGMSRERVLSAAGIKTFSTFDLGNGKTAILVTNQEFYGVKKCSAILAFDSDDKLFGVLAFSKKSSSYNSWKKGLKNDFKYSMTAEDIINEIKAQVPQLQSMSVDEILDLLKSQGMDVSYFNDMISTDAVLFSNDKEMTSGEVGVLMKKDDISMTMITHSQDIQNLKAFLQLLSTVDA